MEYSRSCQQDLKYSLIDIAGKIKKIPNVAGNVWKIQNPCPEISPVKFRAPYIPYCFAMVLTAGFYCDSWAHNVRKVRVVKYIVVSGQIKAANQKYCHNRKWRRKLKETIFRTRGFGDNLHDFWRRYCRAKVLDLSRVVEAHLQTELTPNCFNVRRKNMLFQWTKKLRRELKIRLCT